ncbi:MAG: hypothetical protein IJY15_11705 [Thermoguttaceae bacterium]|nr:hypothetical protein [Thermoguttaceae bacterium]
MTMNQKTIITSDPDERAVVTLEGVGVADSRFRLDTVAFEWRGPGRLKPFGFALDLRGGSLDDEERTASLDVPAAVASTLRAAALELDAEAAAKALKAAKTNGDGEPPRPVEPSVAFRKRLVKTFAVALQALALDLTGELDAETAVKIALRAVDEGANEANGAKETREIKETGASEAREANEVSGAGAFQAEKAKAFAAKFRADAETASGASNANDAKEAVEASGASNASEAREEGGAR